MTSCSIHFNRNMLIFRILDFFLFSEISNCSFSESKYNLIHLTIREITLYSYFHFQYLADGEINVFLWILDRENRIHQQITDITPGYIRDMIPSAYICLCLLHLNSVYVYITIIILIYLLYIRMQFD